MSVVYEAADGSRRNLAGIGYALMKGDLRPGDVEPAEDGVLIRGKRYRLVEE